MKTMQIKNIVDISKLIVNMSSRGATEKELGRVVCYLDGVINDELEFDKLENLGAISDLIDKYSQQ